MTNSVHTNIGAMVALKNMRRTNQALDRVQNRVSTGLRVSNAVDDASSFAIAEGLRADLKSYRAVTQSLMGGKALAKVALGATEEMSTLMGDIQAKITEGMNAGNTTASQEILNEDYSQMTNQLSTFVSNASFNGVNLLKSGATDQDIIANIDGSTRRVRQQSAVDTTIQGLMAMTLSDTSSATQALSTLTLAQNRIATVLDELGSDIRALNMQDNFISALVDAQTEGLGAIVDADLAKESARLQSVQVRQQLGSQTLGIVNQAPQSIMGLFR